MSSRHLKLLSVILVLLSLQCASSYSTKLRGKTRNTPVQVRNDQKEPSGMHTDVSTITHADDDANNLISVTNQCINQVKIHLRYFDGTMKYDAPKPLLTNQQFKVSTNGNVTVALIGAEIEHKQRIDSDVQITDVFMNKCATSERGYIKYMDGLCYKYHFATDDDVDISCYGLEASSSASMTRRNSRLRGSTPSGSMTVEIGVSGPTHS